MLLLTYALKNGICLLIPLPVPKAWESELHRNSTDRLPLFKEGMNEGGVPSASCFCQHHLPLIMLIDQRNYTWQKKNGKGFSAPTCNFSFILPPKEQEYKR